MRCRARRDTVLAAMRQHGWISAPEEAAALKTPVQTAGSSAHHSTPSYFIDYLSGQLSTLYAPEDLASLGLSIYTTIDTQVQQAAETALAKGLARLEKTMPASGKTSSVAPLQGAIVVLKPQTGAVLAMVGGRDYGFSQFNPDHPGAPPGRQHLQGVYLSGSPGGQLYADFNPFQ